MVTNEKARGLGYASAIEAVLENQKTYAFLSGAPLVALLTQLQWLQSINSVWIKLMLTISVICLFASGMVFVYFIDMGSNYLAKVRFLSDDDPRPSPYLKYVEELYGEFGGELTEESLTEISRKFERPLVFAIIIGWTLLLLSLTALIWLPSL